MSGTETYYHLFWNTVILSETSLLAWIGIIISVLVGTLFPIFDIIRRRDQNKKHKKIICHHMNELEDIFAQIMINVNRLEEDEEGISERLNHYLIGKYKHIEYLIDNIKLNKIQCKLNQEEEKDVENTLKITQWLLDEYCPQDVPERNRVVYWRSYNPQLEENSKTLTSSIKHFAN